MHILLSKKINYYEFMPNNSSCPVCGEIPINKVSSNKNQEFEYNILSCQCAGLHSVNKILNNNSLIKFYDKYFAGSGLNKEAFAWALPHFSRVQKYLQDNSLNFGQALDVGCGEGAFIRIALNNQVNIKGIDISQNALTKARQLLHIPKNILINEFIENLEPTANSFDSIFLWDMLEHFSNPELALNKISTLLKDSGLLFIHLKILADSFYAQSRGASYWQEHHYEHLNVFAFQAILNLLNKYNLGAQDIIISDRMILVARKNFPAKSLEQLPRLDNNCEIKEIGNFPQETADLTYVIKDRLDLELNITNKAEIILIVQMKNINQTKSKTYQLKIKNIVNINNLAEFIRKAFLAEALEDDILWAVIAE